MPPFQLLLLLSLCLLGAAHANTAASASECQTGTPSSTTISTTATESPSFDIKGKVVLVTGSNRGIGLSIIQGLLDAGAAKAYAGVRTLSSADDLVRTYGSDRVVPVRIDVSDPTSIAEAAEMAQDVELVVNNAGILEMIDPLSDEFLASLKNQMDVNVFGLVRMAQAFAPILKKNGGGSSSSSDGGRKTTAFVQINSTSSLRCPKPAFAGYAASKAAAFSITQGLIDSMMMSNTLVLSVHPGPIATDMVDQFGGRDRSEPPEQVFEAIADALVRGDGFLVYTDSFSRGMGEDYGDFAKKHVTGKPGY